MGDGVGTPAAYVYVVYAHECLELVSMAEHTRRATEVDFSD